MNRLPPRELAFRVGCPRCGEPPYFTCIGIRGNKRRALHIERHESARKEAKERA